ncbi:MAG: ATP-binding protein [Nitrospirota bacterium]
MKLSILARLFLGYCFLLVLAAGMSVYAIVQLGQVTDVTRSIILVDNSLISLHKDLTDALLSETRYEKKYLIVRDQALYEGFLKSKKEFEQYLKEAMLLNLPDEAKNALQNVDSLHRTYLDLFEEELNNLKELQYYSKTQFAEAKEQAVNAAIEELIKIRLMSHQNIYRKVKHLSEAGTSARTLALFISALCLLAGLVMAIWITQSITRPLSEMHRKTKDISAGVFEANLKVDSPPEIEELARAFNTMCAKLQEVDKMKMDFFALMSHELRTPLTSIKEGTNLLLEGKGGEITDKQKKLLSIISEESDRLIALVNSVLDLSKLESGMLNFTFARTDIAPLISQAVHEVGPLAEAKRITVTLTLKEMPLVSLDSERMLQVLRNLLANALKFTPQGGTVEIAAGCCKQGILITVTDTGPGIPKEHLDVIFDKFRQAPGFARFPGTGLGLAIVKHIILKHGGTVWVQSTEGNGSTFSVQLPV